MSPNGVTRPQWVNVKSRIAVSVCRQSKRVAISSAPDSKVHGTNMGPIWGRQGPVGPMLAPWTFLSGTFVDIHYSDIMWWSCCLRSPATRLFIHQLVSVNNEEWSTRESQFKGPAMRSFDIGNHFHMMTSSYFMFLTMVLFGLKAPWRTAPEVLGERCRDAGPAPPRARDSGPDTHVHGPWCWRHRGQADNDPGTVAGLVDSLRQGISNHDMKSKYSTHEYVLPHKWLKTHGSVISILVAAAHYLKIFICIHDDVTKWKHFPRYWPFVRGHSYPG